ncbi:A24 family peptidase [Undibacterium cyanobacteriorum]|uniref:Prepilin leader peptidase/N-methyltransferase n=1 Tax=Undibacterium cyanobacteriorum TaxID=3073561 RepID=A0ABY9RFZ3_9BURK|nr:A24 family peptidase [Undibacterium sp. 20NA77.5]WMW80151.1 A24 family peptidase [Undibacterium sp. 20NA77.5]
MLDLLLQTPPHTLVSAVFFGIIGLLIGSFLNVVIHRVPKMMERDEENIIAEANGKDPVHTDRYNLMVPRSACPHCGHQITALENIPVISYLVLGGKCSGCKAPISVRYPIVEAITGLLSAFAIWHFGSGIEGLSAMLLLWFLVALTGIDFDTQLLPDQLTLPLVWLGLLVNTRYAFTSLEQAVLGAVFGYMSLWTVNAAYRLWRGHDGMGYGDFKLLAALGAWLGAMNLPFIILAASVVGSVFGIIMLIGKRLGWTIPFAFGPFLAGAGMISLFWGNQITMLYLGLYR